MDDFVMTWFPHGYCLAWNPWLIAADVGGDALIWAAYMALPLVLWRARAAGRLDLVIAERNCWVWGCFIFSCGNTHLFAIFSVWQPIYVVGAFMKWTTALISLATAIDGLLALRAAKK